MQMRRDQPHALIGRYFHKAAACVDQSHTLIGRYFHKAAACVDQLIRSMCVLCHLKPGRVFISERRNRNTTLRIVFCQNSILAQ
jgi:hypothetical protein